MPYVIDDSLKIMMLEDPLELQLSQAPAQFMTTLFLLGFGILMLVRAPDRLLVESQSRFARAMAAAKPKVSFKITLASERTQPFKARTVAKELRFARFRP